ncbi:GxxExxY protein [Cyclobacterium plantarum]|nr:GxxExxY protein [Cyclobacterium plantarum]
MEFIWLMGYPWLKKISISENLLFFEKNLILILLNGWQIMEITKQFLKDLVYQVNGAAIEVHKALGPGLLESVYQRCMAKEFLIRGLSFQYEMVVPVCYKGVELETDLRCDFFVEKILVLELKAVEKILPIHEAQIISYMKLLSSPEGLLINFNTVNIFKEGQRTYVNELFRKLPEE